MANSVCTSGRVSVNGRSAKPAHQLKDGDTVEIGYGDKKLRFRVLSVDEKLAKRGQSELMYQVMDGSDEL